MSMYTRNGKNKLAVSIALSLVLGTGVYGTAWALDANALPDNGTVTKGSATIDDSNKASGIMNIIQNADATTINWNTFNIGSEATVNFKQPNSGYTMVNIVAQTGGQSEIYGHMNASGNVVLINPNGVLFDGATVNVGGLAVYAANSSDSAEILKDLGQANITINNSTINAGVGAAIANAKSWGIQDYAIGLGTNSNKIRLVANGDVNIDVNITETSKLTAVDTTTVTGTTIKGEEEFEMDGNSSSASGQVIIRSDANADDWGTVTIKNDKTITTIQSEIFYNPELVGTSTTQATGTDKDGVKYNKKNYNSTAAVNDGVMNGGVTTATKVTVNEGDTLAAIENDTKKYNKAESVIATADANAKMLVNNIAQLQDIAKKTDAGENEYGNLAGKYALGKNINASADTASYIEGDYLYLILATAEDGTITSTFNGKSLETMPKDKYAKIYLGTDASISGITASEENVKTINSSLWNADKGFSPIGGTGDTGAFTGSFDGFGGDETHVISNLVINRGEQDNVGLFGNVSGSLNRVKLSSSEIVGKNNVGGLVGHLTGSVSNSSNSGKGITAGSNETDSYVKVENTGDHKNIGGLVGLSNGGTISSSNNSATVIGLSAGNVTNVGGVVGSLDVNSEVINGSSKAINVYNSGNVFGEVNTGGIAGLITGSQINDLKNKKGVSSNNGQIYGEKNTGGIAGHADNAKIFGVYNTNEDKALSGNSQYYIDATGKIVKRGSGDTTLQGKPLTDEAALSPYGQITGTGDNTGGLVGLMEKTDSTIDTAYNAGNVNGNTNVGGLVGNLTAGTVSEAYNGDNNTVIREGMTIPDNIKAIANKEVTGTTTTFSFDKYEDSTKNGSAVLYYSFYTSDGTTNTYYYFIPADGKTSKGAGGIYVDKDGNYIPAGSLPEEADRYYLNRIGYKDANITGTGNVGGLVGNLGSKGTLNITYNLGSVTSSATSPEASTGAIAGVAASGATVTNSFWVNGKDASINKAFSKIEQAYGTDYTATPEVKEYTIGDARNGSTLKDDFSTNYVGVMVDRAEGSGYLQYNGNTYQYDNDSTIYTVATDGKTEPAYRRVVNGTEEYWQKVGDTTTKYELTKVENDITLTRQGATEPALTLTADLVASNQSESWLAYQQQSAPMLKYFMNNSNINRVFEYDATTHNLKTDDVTDLYGRSDFAVGSGAGQVVNGDGYVNSEEYKGSSEYYYDNSSIWSPQHGYKMDPNAAVIITPVSLKITLSGNKTYGDLHNLTGYYISVPYTEKVGEKVESKYAFYTVVNNGTPESPEWAYKLVADADLDTFFGAYSKDAAGLQKKADANSTYVVTMNGIISLEATNIDAAVKGVVESLGDDTKGGLFTGNIWGTDHNVEADNKQLNAGDYSFDTTKGATLLSGVTAQHNDYNITYDGKLKVNKADLYFTYDGVREYGSGLSTDWSSGNADGTYSVQYTLAGVLGSDDATNVSGYLKSWDLDKLGYTVVDGKYILSNVDKLITDNTMKATLNGAQKEITVNNANTSYPNSYYHVLRRDSDGKVIGYNLSYFNSEGIKIIGVDDTATASLKNNYKITWIKGGTSIKDATGTEVAKAATSTQTITPATLTVTVEGERNYGDLMNTTNSPTTTTATDGALTKGTYNVVLSGIVANTGDSKDNLLNADGIKAELAKIEALSSSSGAKENQLNEKTNASDTKYLLKDYSGSNITLTTDGTAKSSILYSGDYKVVDGNHSLKIDKADLKVTVVGTKTYGEATETSGNSSQYTTIEGSGLKNGEKFNATGATIVNGVTTEDGAGTYNKDTTHKITGISGLVNDTTGDNTFNPDNYNISIDQDKSSYEVTKRDVVFNTSGTKIYGDAAPAKDSYVITDATNKTTNPASGLTSWDKTNIFDANVDGWKTGLSLSDTINNKQNVGTYGDVDGTTNANRVITIDATAGSGNTLSSNYNISYTDSFTITPRPITVTETATKEYGTGSEHTTYSPVNLGNVTAWDENSFMDRITVGNTSDRTTNVGTYNNELVTVNFGDLDTSNYAITYATQLQVTPADFTYTANHTEYWQGTPIPVQTGTVTNKYGETVTDLVGDLTWLTPANTYNPGIYEIMGHGSNDGSGNYKPLQSTNPNNGAALLIKEKPSDEYTDSVHAFATVRRPLLDVRYLTTKDTAGINRWGDAVITLGNEYQADEAPATTLYDKNKKQKYRF